MRAGAADVLGRRRPGGRGAWPAHARAGNLALSLLLHRRTGLRLRDLGPPRAARREALLALDLTDRRSGYPLQRVVRAADAGRRITEQLARCRGGDAPMTTTPAAWAVADPYATALRTGRGPLFLRRADGWLLPLDIERWCAHADPVDRDVLDRCENAVLDVGCGPSGCSSRNSPRAAGPSSASTSARPPSTTPYSAGSRRCGAPSSAPCPARAARTPSCSWKATSASAAIRTLWTGWPGSSPPPAC
ncbi:hypothetical protein HDC93_003457 [Streptomyces sp. AK010]|nr:hypothetical protein [Streptomyces sp. AK010]